MENEWSEWILREMGSYILEYIHTWMKRALAEVL